MNAERHRRLLSLMRDDLLAPVEAIAHTSQLLIDTAQDPDLEVPVQIQTDLAAVCAAARVLYQFVKENLDSSEIEAESEAGEFDEQLKMLRHNIRNQLNSILGPCQFLLMEEFHPRTEEQDRFFGTFNRDLEEIKLYAETCIDRLNEFAAGNVSTELSVSSSSELDLSGLDLVVVRKVEPAHVLVVDDNQLNREMLARFMMKMGHTCDYASNGREALAKIDAGDYDLVLLDIIMPEMNGLQVLKQLNVRGLLRHLPVLVVSGLDSTPEIVRCIEFGAEDFLSRPINITLLRARVNACLEKKRLREREFSQFFPTEIARQIAMRPEILDEGREADVTLLFCDIRGFSRISEKLHPADTVRWIRDVMELLSSCVLDNRGVLVDYIGDELVAMWGAPTEQPDHARLAVRAALDMLDKLPDLSRRWLPELGLPTRVGIGLNSGKAHVGNTGTARRRKYGPLGNTVNLASRVQGATKYVQTNLLITGSTRDQLGDDLPTRRLCTVKVNNIEAPVDLHEVVSASVPGWKELVERYEAALRAFETRQFRVAASMLGNLLLEHPGDGPSLLLMSRVVNELINESEGEFDPVWPLPGK